MMEELAMKKGWTPFSDSEKNNAFSSFFIIL